MLSSLGGAVSPEAVGLVDATVLRRRMASLLAREAGAAAAEAREWPDEVPGELLDVLGSSFEEVPMFMQDAIQAA